MADVSSARVGHPACFPRLATARTPPTWLVLLVALTTTQPSLPPSPPQPAHIHECTQVVVGEGRRVERMVERVQREGRVWGGRGMPHACHSMRDARHAPPHNEHDSMCDNRLCMSAPTGCSDSNRNEYRYAQGMQRYEVDTSLDKTPIRHVHNNARTTHAQKQHNRQHHKDIQFNTIQFLA